MPGEPYFTEAELAAHTAYCLRDLGNGHDVEPEVRSALAGYDPSCQRSKSFMHTVLATARLGSPKPDIEAACAEADKALDLVQNLRSTRGTEQIARFVHDLEPYHSYPIARDFTTRASDVLASSTPDHHL
jgi:hypothetical protein